MTGMLDELGKEIEELRSRLNQDYDGMNLLNEEMLATSQQLDVKIVQYMQQMKESKKAEYMGL
ncbi:MAG: Spo0E family sporulation regulatory protein-aspartic acid phosphatase [Bacillota bacterium]